MSDFLTAARERVVIYDGAMGTGIQAAGLTADDFGGPDLEGCNELLVVTRPDFIAGLHAAYLDVGCEVVETDSFGSLGLTLAEYGIAERAHELNVAAARVAKEVASSYATPDRPRWVAGSIGPGTKFPSLGQVRYAEMRDEYEVQAHGLIEGGADLLIIETFFDLLSVKAAMNGARRAMRSLGREVPLQVQVTMELTGRMLPGTEIAAALAAIDPLKPDVIGINCATGPVEMGEHLRHLAAHARMPISCIPNAGLPSVVDGQMHYDLTPDQLADHQARFVSELGVNVIGGCCGTTPGHLAAVVERCRDLEVAPRHPTHEAGATSIYSLVPFEQDTSFMIIGERTNANGSKKFREAMLEGDLDTCVQMAKDQVKEGAHVLDLCVDYVGRDGSADMDELAKLLATQASVPVVLDSTEAPVLEAGLQWFGGRAILNSANLEDGEGEGSRFDKVMRLAREYGAAVICLLIDEEGQARDVEWKLRVAHRIHDLAVERYGLEPSDLIFDALTFPLSTGDNDLRRDGINTIDAIRRIKAELPGVFTTLGVSNISFGLKPAARHVLNSVFLHECVEAGLDSAIVHAARIMPLNRIPDEQRTVALDLVYDRRRDDYDPLTALLDVFADVQTAEVEREDRSDWTVEQLLSQRIIDGEREGLEADLDRALAGGLAPLAIINDVLLAGMKVVGELFATGEMQLPFVLQSAETMKTAVAYLEPHMEKDESGGKGRIVLATVKGDVHDIGKNLVDIILTNNGYEVVNLGIKISIAEMIEKALEIKADAIGMSGLLVKSTLIMRENLEELNARGLADIPVLLGGAALTRSYVERDLRGRLRRPALLRQGRLRGSPGDGPPRRDQARLRGRPRVGAGAEREPGAGPQRLVRRLERRPGRARAGPLPRRRRRQPGARAAVHRQQGRQGHPPRRHRRLPQRDRPVPQPVGLPAGDHRRRHHRDRRGVQGAHPPDPAVPARRGQGHRHARAPGRLRLLPRQCRRRRPGDLDRRVPVDRAGPVPLPPPAEGPVPLHRRLLPTGRIGRGRLRRVPHRHHGSAGQRRHRRALRRGQVPGVPAGARPRGRDGRGPRRVLAPPHPRGVGLRRRRRPVARRPVPPAVPRRALLVGLPRVPRPRGQPDRGRAARLRPPRASRSARRRATSTSPSRPRPPSSATTRRPSTSSPAEPIRSTKLAHRRADSARW